MKLHDVAFKLMGWMWKNASHEGDLENISPCL